MSKVSDMVKQIFNLTKKVLRNLNNGKVIFGSNTYCWNCFLDRL